VAVRLADEPLYSDEFENAPTNRYRQHNVSHLAFEQPLIVRRIARITTKQAVASENPKIAGSGDYIVRRFGWYRVFGARLLGAFFRSFVEDDVDFPREKPVTSMSSNWTS
jgi:hypothetical protein